MGSDKRVGVVLVVVVGGVVVVVAAAAAGAGAEGTTDDAGTSDGVDNFGVGAADDCGADGTLATTSRNETL